MTDFVVFKPVTKSSAEVFTVEWLGQFAGIYADEYSNQLQFCADSAQLRLWPTDTTDPYFLPKRWHLGHNRKTFTKQPTITMSIKENTSQHKAACFDSRFEVLHQMIFVILFERF